MSAIIWLAIVAVWGFVLIPMWLRHHDSAVEQRSADRFSTAMRVLSRRVSPRGGVDPLTRATSQSPVTGAQEASGMAHSRAGVPSGPSSDRSAGSDAGAGSVDSSGSADSSGSPDSHATADSGNPAATVAFDDAQPAPHLFGPRSGALRNVSADRAVRAVQAEHTALIRLRRQRLLVLLVAMPISVVLAASLGGMWIVVQLIVDAGTFGYVAHLRRSAQAHRRLLRSRAELDRRIAADRAARARGGIRGWSGGAGAVGQGTPARAGSAGATTRGGDYAPVRLSTDSGGELTEADLAHARADTVDLAGTASRGHYQAGSPEGSDDDADDDSSAGDYDTDEYPADEYAADGYEDDRYDAGGYPADGHVADSYVADSYEGEADGAVAQPAAGIHYTGRTVTRTAYAAYGEHSGHGDHLGPVEYVEYVQAEQVEYTAQASYPAEQAEQVAYGGHPDQPADVDQAAYYEYAPQGEGRGHDVQGYENSHQYAEAADSGSGAPAPGVATGTAGSSGYRAGGAQRPVPRPGARPNTSRPGRVQVNPPGTHGGLIPPAATAGTAAGSGTGAASGAAAASAAAAPADQAQGQTPDELETLLRRHAVGS
ncbi:hypothetical protein Ga0074812_12074 [Parafrankia irregularis]|uniref:Uncharacterized protein n=1 Tax=Parafrankia irregularis TaxID=795642 RepID=A0A0S4QTW7_9ACTN|nr:MULTISPECIES: gephyrin-like molybdotransferase receptor GlpR [Parafrankia]MBE3204953.1 hypothetical protein [Parafrankia sp. CH37]CUU58575.1 hypothetical protein Ga0074812_12074 [Parafrankia irregularis]